MKKRICNKIVIFVIFATLLTPPLSSATIIVPTASISIIVNTQENDAAFHFSLSDVQDFDLQTNNFTASKTIVIEMPTGYYSLSQNNILGMRISNIFCTSDNKADLFSYQKNSVTFKPGPFENITCTFNNVKAPTPVLIVPGITGTEIKKGDELLWANVWSMAISSDDNFMNSLAFNKNLIPTDQSLIAGAVIRKLDMLFGLIEFNYTDKLIQEFTDQNYIENQTLFTFPYDWRYGISGKFSDGKTNVDLLKQKIADIMQQTGSSKVDVVAHSMGGLIVKKYVMDDPTSHHINKAVFVAVPNTGAPKAVKVLLQGDNFGVSFLNDSEAKKIAENMPGIYDLLPTQQYYNQKGSYITTAKSQGPYTLDSEKDLNYQESKSFLIDDHGFNSQALTNAETLHTQAYDDFDLRTAGVDLYAIDGCKSGTLGKIIELRGQTIYGGTYITYTTPKFTPGDGTVPLESSTNLPIDQSNKFYALVSDHGKMPSENGIRQQIVNIIAGSSLPVGSNLITQDISKCELNGKGISVFSPVNIFVTDQFGNKLGLADDGSIINEIPGADFEIWGERKFIYLPTEEGQVYTTNLQGTATGIYTIKVDDIQNTQTTQTEVFSNLPVTESFTGTVNITQDNTTTITIKQTAESQPTTITPSATIDAAASADILPPISAATIAGSQGQPNFYNSDVLINITAQDNNSGILDIEYNLDNAGSQKIQSTTSSIPVATEGSHTITFFATDKAGNNEQPKTLNFTIDKTAPEANIAFDPSAKKINIAGTDNLPDATVATTDKSATISDAAGNTLTLSISKNITQPKYAALVIPSFSYSNNTATNDTTSLRYFWATNPKTNNYALLISAIRTPTERLISIYVPLLNKTYIVESNPSDDTTDLSTKSALLLLRKKVKTLPGMVVPHILTNNGKVVVEY